MLPTKFRVNWPLCSGEEVKNRFSRWLPWRPSWIGTILAIFDLQVTPMSPTKFGVNWPFGAGEEAKYRFSRWRPFGHLGFLIRKILAIFDQQVTLMLPTKFRVK